MTNACHYIETSVDEGVRVHNKDLLKVVLEEGKRAYHPGTVPFGSSVP
jgi:hypothetical protein